MSLPSAMATAAAQPVMGQFFALDVELPAVGAIAAKSLRLLDGSASLTWGGHTYVGSDADYGTWIGFEPYEEAIALRAPKIKTTLLTVSDNAAVQLCSPLVQGSSVTLSMGFLNLSTGQPVSDPIVIFAGLLDVGHIAASDNAKNVDLDVYSAWEYMFLNNEGAKLNSAYHNDFFPSETGFDFVDGVDHQIPWGASGPRPDQVTDRNNWDNTPPPPGGGAGGGGGRGGGGGWGGIAGRLF